MCGQSTLTENEKLDISLPDGLILKTDRVGETVESFDEVQVGETVQFNYYGGSDDGLRTVLVVKSKDDALEGLTLERDGGYRRYHYVDAGTVSIVEPFVNGPTNAVTGNVRRVRFDEAGTALLASLTGEQLAKLYAEHVAVEGDGAEFDPNTGEVVVQLPEPKEAKFTNIEHDKKNFKDLGFTVTNKNGVNLKIFIYSDNTLGIHSDLTGFDSVNPTPENLRDELVKLLA